MQTEVIESVEIIEIEPVIPKAPTTTEEYIAWYAEKNGAPQDLAYWVAWCESELENVPNHNGATYGQGIYQFVQSTWDALCEGDVWNIEDNIKGKLGHWQPYSGHCWLPRVQ